MYTLFKLTSKPRKGLKPCLTFYPTYDCELAFHIYREFTVLATLLRQADICLRLLDPLETADIWLLCHLTNMQLFFTLLKSHLTAFKITFLQILESPSM